MRNWADIYLIRVLIVISLHFMKKFFHHGDTEHTEKLFFAEPGDDGPAKCLSPAGS